jgi:ABC-type glycerol-3-phosphate transport system substrate-binding protein
MEEKMKRICILTPILVLSLIIMLPAGCLDTQQTTAAPGVSSTASADASSGLIDDGSQSVELVIVRSNGAESLLDDTQGQLNVERRWNVKLKAIRLAPDTASTQLGALFASGAKMDIISVNTMADLVAQGVLGEISMDLMKTWMPRFWAATESALSVYGISPQDVLGVEGKIYAFPLVTLSVGRNEWLREFRVDLLKQIGNWGMDNMPATIADYDAVFAAAHAEWPNMYMISGIEKDAPGFGFSDIMGAYTQSFNTWMKGADGKIINSCIAPEARDYLANMADWYEKGYIDPETFTKSGDQYWTNWQAGTQFSCITSSWCHLVFPADSGFSEYSPMGSPGALMKANVPSAELKWGPPVTGPKGKHGITRPLTVSPGIMITRQFAENTIGLIRYMRMCEGMQYNLAAGLDWFGNEGEVYKLEGDPAKPFVTWINGYDVQAKRDTVWPYPFYTGAFNAGEALVDGVAYNFSGTPANTYYITTWRQKMGYTAYDTPEYINIDIPTSGAMPPEIIRLGAENPDKILSEYFDAIILGTKPVDAWYEMVSKWYANGGKERTEWMNTHAINITRKPS